MSNTWTPDERAAVEQARAERDILNTLSEFPRIVDRNEWERVAEVFAENITFNYGDGEEQAGLDALLRQFQIFHNRCSAMQHLLGSIQVEVNGNGAVSRAYVQARHQGRGERSQLFFDTHGEYIDQWERLPQGWRIVRREATWGMFMGDPSVLFDQ